MSRSLLRRGLLAAVLPALMLTPNAFAADHRRQIPIESWSFGPGQSAGTGKVHSSDLSVVMSLEKASPLLQFALASGTHHDAPSGTGKTMAAQVIAGR